MIALFLGVAAIWFMFTFFALRNTLASSLLPAREDLPEADSPPHISIVIAARDEARRIEQTLHGWLRQRDVELELIVVDDRSTDGTGDVLDRLAAEDDRLQVIHVEGLPEGWLGKCHACWLGAQRAKADWLLFTDADVHTRPDLLVRAAAVAERDKADHLCLWPSMNCTRPLTQGCMLAWGLCFANYVNAANINRDGGRGAIGIGAFNLVRREAYDKIGGHQSLRMEVLDDVKLGRLLRRAGFRQRVYIGANDLEVEWALSIGGIIRAQEKNWFAGVGYRYVLSFFIIGMLLALWTVAIASPLAAYCFLPSTYWPLGYLPLAGLLSTIVPGWLMVRRSDWPWYVALLTPLGFFVFALTGAHSTWKTWRQGGIRWRDTFYSLEDLRRGRVR